MNIDQLDPVIKEVAEAYGFKISYIESLDRVIIKDEEMNCNFFWSSEETKPDFFRELKKYFIEIAGERCHWPSWGNLIEL